MTSIPPYVGAIQQPTQLNAIGQDALKWVQIRLLYAGYLKNPREVDGTYDDRTLSAYKAFKTTHYLSRPDEIGPTTVAALAAVKDPDPISEQLGDIPTALNPNAGTKSGRSMTLPSGEVVWSNQWIIPGIPLTWGEMTKDCARVPRSTIIVSNIERFTTTIFGPLRDKLGIPLAITSGYRPPAVNQAIGGAKYSRHTDPFGDAGDVVPSDGNFKRLVQVARNIPGVGGIGHGQRQGFIHLDGRRRVNGAIVEWDYFA